MPEPTIAPDAVDPDHVLVDHLLAYRQPSEHDSEVMASLRQDFLRLGHRIVDEVPRSADRTVALRDLHRATMGAIAALALNPTGR
jgi:hypothetical protein